MPAPLALIGRLAAAAPTQTLCDDCAPPSDAGLWIGLALLAGFLVLVPLAMRISRRRRERAPRLARVRSERAEAEAGAAGLAIHEVRADADELFREVQAAWDARDHQLLRRHVSPAVLSRWEAARAAREELWASPVRVDGGVEVEYVGLGESPEGRTQVLVRVQSQLDGWAPRATTVVPRRRGSLR